MSTLYRLRFLDVSISWWAVLALYGLAAGGGRDGRTAELDSTPSPPGLNVSLEE